jgi:uncharacterized protein YdeI (BOF family)
MTRVALLTICVAVLGGCSAHDAKTLGAAIEGESTSVAQLQRVERLSSVVLHGTMTKKCPVAGCWFLLRDQTGTIKVDTKNAGFVVVDVPLNATVTISGHVVTNGSERFIDASGLRY